MEILVANLAGEARRVSRGDREYLVAPITLIVPGVLNGSQGPLYYPPEEVARDPGAWDGVYITLEHPRSKDGQPVSARSPGIFDSQGMGVLRNTRFEENRLKAEGWFDISRTASLSPVVLSNLELGNAMEVSTGLHTRNVPAVEGATENGKPYTATARDYRPDHLAVLAIATGACSVQDGCGLNVNRGKEPMADNQLSHRDLRFKLNALVQQRYGQHASIDDVFDKTFVYSVGSGPIEGPMEYKLFQLGYSSDLRADKVSLAEGPGVEVTRSTAYKPVKNEGEGGKGPIENLTKKEGDEDLPPSAYAYIPDPQKPSTWKLRIDDKAHVAGAVAAIGPKGFRGQKVSVPAADLPGVKKKIRAAWLKFNPDKTEKGLPLILNEKKTFNPKGRNEMNETERKAAVDLIVANCGYCDEDDKAALNDLSDEKLMAWKTSIEKAQANEAVVNAAKKELGKDPTPELIANALKPKVEAPVTNEPRLKTEEEWLKEAPASVKEMIAFSEGIIANQRKEIVGQLTANLEGEAKERMTAKLNAMPMADLQDFADLVPKPAEKKPEVLANWLGASAPAGSTPATPKKVEPLPLVESWLPK